jgi:hypothetical protein
MALSDLELLSLVERAQEAKQGPIGPQGVGIRSIEQPDASTVVISLTDGRTKEINLTAGPKGDPGEAGKPGRDGAEGRPGSAGKAGAAGVGVAGAPGRDGTSIDTAIVNADGNLLLGLTDGNVLNVGRVVGPAGATGPTGPTGLPGRAGRDGNTILSAPHAPSDDEGNPGDFWIDTSSPLFDFYGKGSSGWRKLTSLRAPQTPVGGKMSAGGGGGGGNGGSGGGALQNTATLPLANPSRYKPNGKALPPSDGLKSQKDLNEWLYASLLSIEGGGAISVGQIPPMPSEKGMLWFSTNEDELTLFIYVDDQSGWVPAAPPVSLDGINTTIASIDEELMTINRNVAINKSEVDEQLFDFQKDQQRQDDGIGANARDITQLRGRVGDLEAGIGGGDFLPTAGGELKGGLEINGSRDKDGKINPLLCRADGYYMSFGVNKDGAVFAGSSEGQPFMASSGWHVVTKGYLDSHVPRHFGSPYIFKKDKAPADLETGEFTYDSDWNWYAHRYDAEGDRIGVSSDHTFTTDGMLKVYKYNGAINLVCIMHRYESCKCGQDENDHMKWKKKASIYTHTDWLDDGKTYYLSDGFLLPQ